MLQGDMFAVNLLHLAPLWQYTTNSDGGQTTPFPQRSLSQEVAKEMEETWKSGYQADQSFRE